VILASFNVNDQFYGTCKSLFFCFGWPGVRRINSPLTLSRSFPFFFWRFFRFFPFF